MSLEYIIEELSNKKILKFNQDFNAYIEKYPDNITDIIYGLYFNQELENIPETVKIIVVNLYYRKSIDYLPCTVEILILGLLYDLPVNNLPNGLKMISFGTEFNQSIDNLPQTIEIIFFGYEWIHEQLYGYEGVKFDKEINKLPKNLRKIYYYDDNNFTIDLMKKFKEIEIITNKDIVRIE